MKLFVGTMAIAVAMSLPAAVLAGNREVAQDIGAALRDSGQLVDYNIAVKYKDGTVWLNGRVTDHEQMSTAMRLAKSMPEVTKVVNQLTIEGGSEESAAPARAVRRSPTVRRVSVEQYAEGDEMEEPLPQPVRKVARKSPKPIRRVNHAMPMGAACPPGMGGPGMGMGMGDDGAGMAGLGRPLPAYAPGMGGATAPAKYDSPYMPNYAWPSYASYPNYAAVTYPRQYSPTAWPFIGPFYPYPQVPLGWRKVTLEWDDGWWFLDFKDDPSNCW